MLCCRDTKSNIIYITAYMLDLQCRRKEENRRLTISILLVWHHLEVKCLEHRAVHFDFYINTMFFVLKHLLCNTARTPP